MKYKCYTIDFKQKLTESQHNIVKGYFQDFINNFYAMLLESKEKLKKGNIRMRLSMAFGGGSFKARRDALIYLIEGVEKLIQENKLFISETEDRQTYYFLLSEHKDALEKARTPFYQPDLSKQFQSALEKKVLIKPEIKVSEVERDGI